MPLETSEPGQCKAVRCTVTKWKRTCVHLKRGHHSTPGDGWKNLFLGQSRHRTISWRRCGVIQHCCGDHPSRWWYWCLTSSHERSTSSAPAHLVSRQQGSHSTTTVPVLRSALSHRLAQSDGQLSHPPTSIKPNPTEKRSNIYRECSFHLSI